MSVQLSRTLPSFLVSALLAGAAAAQGVLPLTGQYAYGTVAGEFGSAACVSGGAAVSSEIGFLNFAADGSFTALAIAHNGCSDGSFSFTPSVSMGTYSVATDATLTLDFAPVLPGTQVAELQMRPDLSFASGGYVSGNGGTFAIAMVRQSTGLGSSTLSGDYHVGRLRFTNGPGGVSAFDDLGTMTYDGVGAYSESVARHSVAPDGTTSDFPASSAGTYAVSGDGTTVWDTPGDDGAVTADGEVYFRVERNGPAAGLSVGVRKGSGMPASLLGGAWGYGANGAFLGVIPGAAIFSSAHGQASLNAGTMTYAASEKRADCTPFGCMQATASDSGSFSMAGDGSFSFASFSATPPLVGGIGSKGTMGVAVLKGTGQAGLAIFSRGGKWPASFGSGTPGTGGLVPVLSNVNGFPFTGNLVFGLRTSNAVGGGIAVLAHAAGPGPGFPLLGGVVWLDIGTAVVFAVQFLSGPAGVAGAGAVNKTFLLPPNPSLDGLDISFQSVVLDAGGPAGYAMSQGLSIELCR